jgi:HAD superfamily hydrolase (TIGR01509 family)
MNILPSKNPIIQAIAFDMDGLMFNTEDLYDEVGDILLSRRGQQFELDLKLKMMGRPGTEAFAIMKTHCGIDDSIDQLQQESKLIFADLLPARIQMMPGLDSLLTFVEANSLPKCVATSSHRQFAHEALDSFDLRPRFDFILTADDVENGKPAPDIYLAAAKRLSVPIDQMLVLEDSVIGSTAAAEAGAYTIAVPTSHSVNGDFSHVHHTVRSLESPIIRELLNRGRS